VKNQKECISILAVDFLDLHLVPEQVVSFQNSRFFGFFFLTAGKKPSYIHYGILRKTTQCNFASETS